MLTWAALIKAGWWALGTYAFSSGARFWLGC